MHNTIDISADAAVRRYIAAAATGGLTIADAAVDGADLAELYTTAAGYATKLLDQFSLDGEAPLIELLDTLTDTTVNTWALEGTVAELVAGFSKLTGFEGDFDGAAEYTAAVEANPNEATTAALAHTATLAIIVAEATGADTDTTLDMLDA